MACKYKQYENTDGIHPWCYVTRGCECQFLNAPYDQTCAILAAYPDIPMPTKKYDKVTVTGAVTTNALNIFVSEGQ